MEISKIQITGTNTLNIVYGNYDGDTIAVSGANIVHKDMKKALRALIPHLALLTEQKEADGKTLQELNEDSDIDTSDVFLRMNVTCVQKQGDNIIISGNRILNRRGVIKISTPKINLNEDEYQYLSSLSLDIEGVMYEAEQYITEKKWGRKEGTLDFEEDNPFSGIEPGEVPTVTIEVPDNGTKKKQKEKV